MQSVNDICDKVNVYFCKGVCGCFEITGQLVERVATAVGDLCDRFFPLPVPDNVQQFRASIAFSREGDLKEKCEVFVRKFCEEKGYDPHAAVTSQRDSDMKSDREEDVKNFLQQYFSTCPQMMEAFSNFKGLNSRDIRKID